MKRFENKVAFVTGGAGAIGQAIARRLASEGATVVLGDVVESDQNEFDTLNLDVTDETCWVGALQTVLQRHGRLDVLVNNAGVVSPEPQDFEDVALAEWKRVFSINVEGTFLGVRQALKIMKDADAGGAIVNIGSIAGYYGVNKASAYGASKAAVKSLTKQAAISAARLGYNVRVNSVHPSYIWTPLVQGRLLKEYGDNERAMAAVRAMNPMQRLVEPVDVAAAVAFLASDDARMITGSDLVVDCGRLIQ